MTFVSVSLITTWLALVVLGVTLAGFVHVLMFAVDNGADHFICAGPVLSHYEFEVLGDPRRLDDNEWQQVLSGNDPPDVPASRIEGLAPPVWTQSYLVPLPAQ